MLAIQLPEDVESRLDSLARNTGQTKAFYVCEAIISYLADIEDLRVAEKRLLANRAGRSQSHSLDDVMKRYGLAS